MRQTSLFAWRELQPRIGKSQGAVLVTISFLGKCTDKNIAASLGWSINRVTPRRGELVKAGFVIADGVTYQGGRPATLWRMR